MTCPICEDRGILIQPWTDAEPDFALCVCPAAAWYRSDINAGRHTGTFGWQLWCAHEQIDPARVYRLEEIYTQSELAAAGLVVDMPPESLVAALLTASKRRPRL